MDSDSNDPLEWENWTGDLPFWQHAFCGSIAGVMEHISLFPLDTIKTRLQIDSESRKYRHKNGYSHNEYNKNHKDLNNKQLQHKSNGRLNKEYSSKVNLKSINKLNNKIQNEINSKIVKNVNRDIVTDAFRASNNDSSINLLKNVNKETGYNFIKNSNRDVTMDIIKNFEGKYFDGKNLPKYRFYSNLFRGNLFRGSNVIVAGCVPAHVLYFTVYEKLKRAGNVALSGASATLCHDLVLTPADVIKQRLQLGCYKNSFDCFSNILRNEGVNALFRSLQVTLFMNVPYHSLLVSIIHLLKGGKRNEKIENYKHFIYAGIGGAVAGALTTPFDVIKTRLQTQTCSFDSKRPRLRLKYKNILATFENIYRREGLKGFMRGITTRVGMCTPSAAISWGTYETLKNIIKMMS